MTRYQTRMLDAATYLWPSGRPDRDFMEAPPPAKHWRPGAIAASHGRPLLPHSDPHRYVLSARSGLRRCRRIHGRFNHWATISRSTHAHPSRTPDDSWPEIWRFQCPHLLHLDQIQPCLPVAVHSRSERAPWRAAPICVATETALAWMLVVFGVAEPQCACLLALFFAIHL